MLQVVHGRADAEAAADIAIRDDLEIAGQAEVDERLHGLAYVVGRRASGLVGISFASELEEQASGVHIAHPFPEIVLELMPQARRQVLSGLVGALPVRDVVTE